MSTGLNRKALRRERTALMFLGYGLVRIGMKAPQEGPITQAERVRQARASVAAVTLALLAGCSTPVALAGSCRAHQAGAVQFNERDCPVAQCLPVDGGFAWVRIEEDACR